MSHGRHLFARLVLAAALTLLARAACATWTSDSTVNLRVAPSTHHQRFPVIAPDGSGGAFVAWSDYGTQQNTLPLVYMQHITTGGGIDPRWPVDGLFPDSSSLASGYPSLISDSRQGVIIVWRDGHTSQDQADLTAQRLDQSGRRLWGSWGTLMTVGNTGPGSEGQLLVPDSSGGAIAAWMDRRDGGNYWGNIFARRVNFAGVALWADNGVHLAPGAWPQTWPAMAPDSSGGAIVAWGDDRDGSPFTPKPGIYGQHVDKDGNLLWGTTGMAICPASVRLGQYPSVCADGAGGAYIAWIASRPGAGSIYAQHILATGDVAPGWPPNGAAIDTVTDTQYEIDAVADGNGGALLVWYGTRSSTGYVVGQHVNASGSQLWGPNGLVLGPGYVGLGHPIADGKGGLLGTSHENGSLTWCTGTDRVRSQRLNSGGALLWGGYGTVLSVGCGSRQIWANCTDDAGGLIAVWEDYRNQPVESSFPISNIYAQRVAADGTLGGDVVDALLSLASADATTDRVSLRWYTTDRAIAEADVERSDGDDEWRVLARIAPDGSGMLSYEDTDIVPAHRYGYRLNVMLGGNVSAMGETWVSVPAGAEFALRNVQPNPSDGELSVSFALPGDAPARLEVLDLAGRRVASREVGALGAGTHVVRFTREASALRPGVYAIRLTSGGRSVTTRAVVVR
jgi:hypothetical protein